MAQTLDDLPLRAALVEIARDFHARGFMAGTAGNLSARADDAHFWITTSGKPKGRLDESDFLLVQVSDGAVVERAHATDKPSAETAIHAVLYALFPDARAVLHGHSVAGCLAGACTKPKATGLRLPAIEMLKGFDIWKQHPKIDLPLFENTLEVSKIATTIRRRFTGKTPALTALMVRDHGPTVWGRGLQEAYDRFEVLDFLLRCLAPGRPGQVRRKPG